MQKVKLLLTFEWFKDILFEFFGALTDLEKSQ